MCSRGNIAGAPVAQQSRQHVCLQVAPYVVAFDQITMQQQQQQGASSCECMPRSGGWPAQLLLSARISSPLNVGSTGPRGVRVSRRRTHPGSVLAVVPISQGAWCLFTYWWEKTWVTAQGGRVVVVEETKRGGQRRPAYSRLL